MKQCSNCKKWKETIAFHKRILSKDGLSYICKVCSSMDRKKYYIKNQNDICIKKSEYYHNEYKRKKDPVINKKALERYSNKFPEKRKAKLAAIHINTLRGEEKHHWSYNKEKFLDVFILTKKDHSFIHRYLVYDQLLKLYRTKDGTLLDTREKAESYYSLILNVTKQKEEPK